MNSIFDEAWILQQFLISKGFKFCFIGGLAVLRWGEVRITNDIDLTLLTKYENEDYFIEVLIAQYEARIPDAIEMARAARVLLLRSTSGVGIDIALGGMPFEESAVSRSSLFEIVPDLKLLTCSAEDLIIYKTFASRPKDWGDIEGIILRNQVLDWSYIEQQLVPLLDLKEEPEQWDVLLSLKKKLLSISKKRV